MTASARDAWDRWAPVYLPLERFLLGRTLERTRTQVAALAAGERGSGSASAPWLVVGDGDGRGIARLLGALPGSPLISVDVSGAMLQRARRRITREERDRTRWVQARLPQGLPEFGPVAGIVTTFFLDCFNQEELARVWRRLATGLEPGGLWIVADFTHPLSLEGWRRLRQGTLLALLYQAFRWTTPIQARRLPCLDQPFTGASWRRTGAWRSPGGLTTISVWRKPG